LITGKHFLAILVNVIAPSPLDSDAKHMREGAISRQVAGVTLAPEDEATARQLLRGLRQLLVSSHRGRRRVLNAKDRTSWTR
jgi:hypothetical protein